MEGRTDRRMDRGREGMMGGRDGRNDGGKGRTEGWLAGRKAETEVRMQGQTEEWMGGGEG